MWEVSRIRKTGEQGASAGVESWQTEPGWRGSRDPGGEPGICGALTCDVQLVQPVIGQGCVPGAGLGFVLKACRGGRGGPPVPEDLLEQPADQAQLLQAVADHIPGEAAGQVQAGGGQRPAQHRQAGLQVGSGGRKVPLESSRCNVHLPYGGLFVCFNKNVYSPFILQVIIVTHVHGRKSGKIQKATKNGKSPEILSPRKNDC